MDVTLGNSLFYSTGSSEEARYVDRERMMASSSWLNQSATFSRSEASRELVDLWLKCRMADWDGCGGERIEVQTLLDTKQFIDALPSGFPSPSLGVEPDGHVSLEWYRGRRWVLSVSISPEGMIYWAALFGSSSRRGSEPFYGEVPGTIIELIRKVGMDA